MQLVRFTLRFWVFKLLCGLFIMTSPIITQVTYFLSCNIIIVTLTLSWCHYAVGHLVYLWFTILTVLSSAEKWSDIKSSQRRKDWAYTGVADATSRSIFARSVIGTHCTVTMLYIISNSFPSPHIENSRKYSEIIACLWTCSDCHSVLLINSRDININVIYVISINSQKYFKLNFIW